MTIEEKKKNVLDVFNTTAESYVKHFADDWEFKKQIDEFIESVGEQAVVLDLGCGNGYITNYLQQRNLNPIGIDFSENMLKLANKQFSNIKFIRMDICDIGKYFEENTIDGSLAIYSLYFIPKDQIKDFLSTLSKLLKDGGKMLLVTQCGNGEKFVDESLMPDGKGKGALFVNLYNQEELRALLEENNFTVENMTLIPNIDPDEISGDGRLVVSISNHKTLKL